MRKIVSLILTIVLAIFGSVAVAAETTEVSFPMINTTGIVYLKGVSALETDIEPVNGIEDSITITSSGAIPNITSVTLEVQGKKFGNNYIVTDKYEFDNYDSLISIRANPFKTGDYWKLNLYDHSAPIGSFLVANFDAIYSLKIVATGNFETKSEKIYNNWGTNTKYSDAVPAFIISENFTNSNFLTDCITAVINNTNSFEYVGKEVSYDYAFIGDTDTNNNGIVERNEVIRLSYSELGEGKGLPGFEGLASQVTEFFSHKNNGKITFNLTSSETPLATTWEWGGIPSTQVGIFSNPERISNDVVGLFFNYNSTGSLLAQGKIDNDKIVFDITDVLTDLGGHTAGVLENIYYGFIGGVQYNGYGKGLKIESVTLSYETEDEVVDEVVEEIIEPVVDEIEEVVETEVTVTEVPEEITTPEETTAPEIVLVEDTTTEVPVVVTADTEVAGEDENPHTGVALVVAPFVAAFVAGVISKKRK